MGSVEFANADRRTVLMGAAAATTLLMTGAGAHAATDDMADLKKAIAAGHDATVKRLQDWIAHPSIAAENRNMQEGAKYMMQLALDAGFQHAEVVQTSGAPGVSATYAVGAPKPLWVLQAISTGLSEPCAFSSAAAIATASCPSMRQAFQPQASKRLT